MNKREREEAALMQVGVGKKKGKGGEKKQAKRAAYEVEEAFKIDITAINKFGFLKVSPPLEKESLDIKIKELTEKMENYEKEGEIRLKEEEEKLVNEGVIEDEEPEKRERRDDDDGNYRRGGRGGFRGSRGGRGGFRGQNEGGRGRGGRPQRDRSEE